MAVTFNSVGGGDDNWGASGTTGTLTWSHTAAGGSDCVVVAFIAWFSTNAPTGYTRAVTYGGVSMVRLGSVASTDTRELFEVYYLFNPNSGAQTVIATMTGASTTYNSAGNTVSYIGAAGTPILTTNFGLGTSSSVSVSSATGHMVVSGQANWSAVPSSFSATQRGNSIPTGGFVHSIQDSLGSSSVNMTTSWSGNYYWVAAGVDIDAAGAGGQSSFFTMFS